MYSSRLAAAAHPSGTREKPKAPDLPIDLAALYADNTWTYHDVFNPSFEIYWNSMGGDEVRITQISSTPLLDAQPVFSSEDKLQKHSLEKGKLRATMKVSGQSFRFFEC